MYTPILLCVLVTKASCPYPGGTSRSFQGNMGSQCLGSPKRLVDTLSTQDTSKEKQCGHVSVCARRSAGIWRETWTVSSLLLDGNKWWKTHRKPVPYQILSLLALFWIRLLSLSADSYLLISLYPHCQHSPQAMPQNRVASECLIKIMFQEYLQEPGLLPGTYRTLTQKSETPLEEKSY